ncbi:hypothetical protein [Leisingera sp. JC1]|uniref:hypothetical protein n=1 Tax=Leisingera sp. JC1 TaxID=1855282 RepID=UPI0011316F20|nr:hypothetical protein [Leisingera sp. JC1]
MSCEVLWSQYQLLHTTYEGFNDQSLILKGWSVTIGLAAIVTAYSDAVGSRGRVVVLAAAFSATVFWLVDAFWKSYQLAYKKLLEISEASWDCSGVLNKGPSIQADWPQVYSSFDFFSVLHFPSVALPHGFVVALGVCLAWKFPPKSN